MADNESMEAILWSEIANAQARDALIGALLSDEQTSRAAIVADRGLGVASLANVAAQQAVGIVHAATARCNDVTTEALAWRNVADEIVRECDELRHRSAVHERMLHDEMHLKQQLLEQELASKTDVHGVHAALHADVRDLQEKKFSLERAVTELSQELNAMQTSWQAHRISVLDEKHQLEQQLDALRAQINVERANLQEARAATAAATAAAAAASKAASIATATGSAASPSPPMSAAPPQSAAAAPTTATPGASVPRSFSTLTASHSESSYLTPHRAAHATGAAPSSSLASGLAALQNVREQLREMREASNSVGAYSPSRASSAAVLGGDRHDEPVDAHSGLRHANSYAYYPTSPNGSGGGGNDGGAGSAASPWKARLLKLQGELKSLRTELGSASPE